MLPIEQISLEVFHEAETTLRSLKISCDVNVQRYGNRNIF